MKYFKFFIVTFFALLVFVIQIKQADARISLLNDTGESLACVKGGENCSLNDFIVIGIRVTEIILGVCGSIALLAFVAGGFMMVMSAGNPDLVKRGKDTIIGAVIGLIIIFTSYLIIQFVIEKGLGGTFYVSPDGTAASKSNNETTQDNSSSQSTKSYGEQLTDTCLQNCTNTYESCVLTEKTGAECNDEYQNCKSGCYN
jgi:hypothetical protein